MATAAATLQVASHQIQSVNAQTGGGTSPITGSGNNAQTSTNTNSGGVVSR